jgi:peptidoglycan/xylan/chitin deacetylase (PgdA/CDA1 family)
MTTLWPNGMQAAVSLTFDDGMDSQLHLAVPELDRRGLRATFYMNPRGTEDGARYPLPWRAALERWAILTFHGINEGHLSVSPTDFIELLDHLERRRNALWVAPVAEVAAYLTD